MENSSEVMNMLLTEWNWDDAKEVWQEEAREDGIEIGLKKGELKKALDIARNALAEGVSLELVQKITGLDIEAIKNLINNR